jgi:hypothetical protein
VARATSPSQAILTSYVKGNGTLAQVDTSRTAIGTFPATLTSPLGSFWYTAPASPAHYRTVDSLPYTCTCNGALQTGIIQITILAPMTPDPTIRVIAIASTTSNLFLHGSIAHPGALTINITTLPALGSLSQLDFYNPHDATIITHPNTMVTNALSGVKYIPKAAGKDSFQFLVTHGGLVSSVVTVVLTVSAWNVPPVIPPVHVTKIILDRKPTPVRLDVVDVLQKQYLGVYIMSMPTKGTLYQRMPNGTIGPPILGAYQRTFVMNAPPLIQYATAVLNVSSFWGGSKDWSPLQTLGPKDCFAASDCTKAWSPLTMNGQSGFASGSGQGLKYAANPNKLYEEYGYTEFIELKYKQPVRASALLIGENRGMGAIKNILAMDPLGHWMNIWSASTIDATIETLYYAYNQYRTFVPDLCLPPFLSDHYRFEIDTRDVPDWYVMGGIPYHIYSSV